MSDSVSAVTAPTGKQLLHRVLVTVLVAALVLVLVVLPAEYGIDLTGFGRVTGLNALSGPATNTVVIRDVTGGNETLREVQIPDAGDPTPLPNPAVFQEQSEQPRMQTVRIEIPPGGETEVKAKLQEGKVILYSWQVEKGSVYIDFHGHDPAFGPDFFVRYQEIQEGATHSNGSLTAPFAGEHGWYWLNYNEEPVVITLTVSGYYDEIIDYGIF
jgi:hypothetical protein